jgi:excisionase family DNA binding protein
MSDSKPSINPNAFYTRQEVARALSVGKTTVIRWERRGLLPVARVGSPTAKALISGRALLALLTPQES